MNAKTLKSLSLAAAVLGTATSALAQQQQQPAARGPQTPSGRAPGGPPQPAPRPAADVNLLNRATLPVLPRTNGSLLRAQVAATPQPTDTRRPAPVSYFEVPEPEPKVIRKHDLVTIVVREESDFSVQGVTDTKREAAIDARIDEFIKLRLNNMEIEGGAIGPTPPSIKANANRNFKGEGTVSRTESLTTRVTAEVVDVKPNGTLVLQARKSVKTDDEEQSVALSGTCRVEDIVADNTVLSTQLYDLRVEKSSKGAVRSATKRGVVGQILDFLNPF